MTARRLTAFGVAGAVAVLGVVLPTQAATAAVDPATPDVVTTDALPTWQINGVVYSQAIVGNTVYVTGSFTKARPPGVAAGGAGEVDALNIFAYDITTGNRVASFNHSLNAQGLVIKASPDKSRIYVGGDFSAVDGVARGKVAAFNVATGALVSGGGYVPPNVGGQVRGLGITASTVYVGGNFLSANGVARTRLAAFQNSNGAMLPWAPKAENGYVWTMTMSPDNSKVIPGGSFTTLNGVPAMGMGAVDAATGATLPWAATSKIHAGGSQAAITALKTDGQRIYGGAYAFVLGQEDFANFEGTFGLNPDTGAIEFVNDCLGDTYDVAPIKDLLYMVSHYHDCTAVDSIPDTNPRARWQKAAVTYNHPTDLTTRNDVYGWNYQGYQYARMLHWWPDLSFGTYTSAQQAAWTIDAVGDYVVMGGEFPRVNGALQQGLVRMKTKATAPKLRGPRYTTVPATPTPSTNAVSLTAGTVRVSWGSAWDQEDKNLKYEVLRNNNTFVYTTTGDSEFWDLPTKGFVDTGLTPGSSVRYQVRITDSDGNILWSPVSNTVTVGSGSPSAYAQTVIDDGASHLWRLGESSGGSIDWAGFDDLTMSGGYTRGATGSIIGDTDKATTFGGSDGLGATTSQIVGPDVFSLETWFRTTTTSGGKLVGFGNANTGTSTNYDRHIYMEPNGRITFGIYHDGFFTTTSPTALNDGQWHHVVGTMGPSGLTLYVDGKKVGTNGGTSVAQAYSGYWRVGGDSPWSGNAYFAGDLDDVAVYPTVLPVSKVQSHYIASGRTLNVPTRPSDSYGQAVWDANPDLYWRLGDSSSTAKDSGPNESNGTYRGGYTQGQPGAFDGATNKAVTFDGNNGFVSSDQAYSNPRNYSLEAWFKTTSTNGGKILGFGCAQDGLSGCYDRHIYISNDGKLTFGVWTGFTNTITTPAAVNDGQWHYVVATQNTTDGMKLYLDGALVGTNGQTDAQAYDGYWRVGGDNHWGCCSPYLAGTIDEVAVYPAALSAGQVSAHFAAGGGSVPNQLPNASFTHTENDLSLSVNGTGSSDPDGSIIGYSWNWGDGTPVGSGATASHTYAVAGTYNVTLMVTDNDGDTDTETAAVTVNAPPPNQPPTAAFTHTESFLKTSVDASTSSDPDGTIVQYSWDWGDGSPGTVGASATASHTYASAGTYTVTVTAIDDDGATDDADAQVTVVENQAPTAAFTHTETNLAMSVNGSTSSDPDGTIASYSWNWGDATPAGSGATANHTYAAAGTYTVVLTVTDDGGKTDTESQSVTVTGPPNQPPTASFTHTENALATSVNGSASNDPDGTIASYSWNWGDLTANGSGATANHTYAAAGTYTVTLTVTDDGGATDTETASVTVAAATVFARDDFGRTVASGWGSADVGGPWTLGGLTSRWSVSGGVGRVSLNAGDGFNGYLPSVSSTSTEVRTLITTDKVPTGGGQYVSVLGRRVSSTVDYRVKARMAAGGAVAVWLTRNSSGAETVLTSATLAGVNYGAGDALRVRLQVTGTAPTTLRVKVWKDGTSEPATWSLTSTDSTAGFQAPGSVGLYPYVSGTATNGPVVYSFDEWWVGPPQP